MEILGFDGATIAEDGRHIEIILETDTGPVSLEANILTVEDFVSQILPILLKAREMRGGVSAASPVEPSACVARPTQDLQRVLLALRLPNGLDQAFAIRTDAADTLSSQLADAAKLCRSA